MKRRNFLWRTGAITVGGAALSLDSASQSSARKLLRTSRLFGSSTSPSDRLIQDVILVGDAIISLHGNIRTRDWRVTAVTSQGSLVWEFPLPTGVYSALGIAEAGAFVLIHAFSYGQGTTARRNCILQLLPRTGEIKDLGFTDAGGSNERMFFAGDSFLVRLARTNLEVWNVQSDAVTLTSRGPVEISASAMHVDLISPGDLAFTARDGSTMSIVSIPSGTIRELLIAAPEIIQARSILDQLQSERPINEPGTRVPASIIAVTGANPMRRVLNALVLPVRVNEPTPVLAIDLNGTISVSGLYDIRHERVAMRLITGTTSELGVIYGDTTIGWYPPA